jgi:hypothetical protein
MKIPKQSKPVRRAGFATRLKIKGAGNIMPSTLDDDDVDDDNAGAEEENDYDEAEDAGEDSYDALDEGIE